MALINKLTEIADAIREKTNTTDLLTLDDMPTLIASITTGSGGGDGECNGLHVPEESLVFEGDCSYLDYAGKFDWLFEMCGNKITTNNVTYTRGMFSNSKIKEIPFEINIGESCFYIDSTYLQCHNCFPVHPLWLRQL